AKNEADRIAAKGEARADAPVSPAPVSPAQGIPSQAQDIQSATIGDAKAKPAGARKAKSAIEQSGSGKDALKKTETGVSEARLVDQTAAPLTGNAPPAMAQTPAHASDVDDFDKRFGTMFR
ncbi:MAG: hypothetical protein ING19_17485, partial [Azospirillum sp.]|nr:hypothetical protein [Azospirillum sp.]